jgi:RNA polymerase sigma-70 factor (ECF subfamily)
MSREHSQDADQLLALMQAGDLLALDAAARRYGSRLLVVARRACHLPGDAEDAVQSALLSASTAMTSIRGDGSPLAWLSTLVARHCQRLNQRAARGVELDEEEAECGCDSPEAQAERTELGRALSDALMSFSRVDRLLFLLSAEGFDGVELAERFGLSHDAVRGRLKRTRAQLRVALARFDTLEAEAGTHRHERTDAAAVSDSRHR